MSAPGADRPPGTGGWAGRDDGRPAAEKSLDFKGSSRRLLRMLRPERALVVVVLALGRVSVALSVIGPKILGHATDLIFAGVVGQQLPAGHHQGAGASRRCARTGRTRWPTCCPAIDFVPGQRHRLRRAVGQRAAAGSLVIYLARLAVRRRAGPAHHRASCSAPCTGCASRSRPSCPGCR